MFYVCVFYFYYFKLMASYFGNPPNSGPKLFYNVQAGDTEQCTAPPVYAVPAVSAALTI